MMLWDQSIIIAAGESKRNYSVESSGERIFSDEFSGLSADYVFEWVWVRGLDLMGTIRAATPSKEAK